jgi:hypothetical protein
MPLFLKATGVIGSILVLIALLIAFMKSILAFIGFITVAIKILIVLVFVALIVGIGYMILKGWKESRKSRD